MGVKVREKRKGSGEWWIFINHAGNRKAVKVGSKKAAEDRKRDWEKAIADRKMDISPPPQQVSFKKHAEKWYNNHVLHTLKPSTREHYRKQLDKHILPWFGNKAISKITRAEIKECWSKKLDEGLAGSIRVFNTILSSIFTDALEENLIYRNPAAKPGKNFPKRVQNEDFHTVEEGYAILKAAKACRPQMYLLFLTAWAIGAREGELIGLEWSDIDWRGGFIVIQRTDYHGHVGTTKTGKTRRTDMAEGLASILESHRKQVAAEALRKGMPIPSRVFTTKTGQPYNAANIRRAYEYCQMKAGVRQLSFHTSTRKGFGSGHLNAKESLSYIGNQLGHSDIKQTAQAYAFLKPGNPEAANRLFDQLINGKSATPAQPVRTVEEKSVQH
jgi:integrase